MPTMSDAAPILILLLAVGPISCAQSSGAPEPVVCAHDRDCGTGSRCNFAIERGVCSPIYESQDQEPCSGDVFCDDGLMCVGSLCRSHAVEGESCAMLQCAPGLRCHAERIEHGPFVCVDPSEVGSPCNGDYDCDAPLSCARPDDPDTSVCSDGAEGSPCSFHDPASCDDALSCGGTPNVCHASGTIAEGEPCLVDEACASGLVCLMAPPVPGICVPPGDNRDECAQDSDCASGLACVDPWGCAGPGLPGEACDLHSSCVSGSCDCGAREDARECC